MSNLPPDYNNPPQKPQNPGPYPPPQQPYAPPQQPYAPPQQYYRPDPKSKLSGPATGLLVAGIISVLGSLGAIAYGIMIYSVIGSVQQVMNDPEFGDMEGMSEDDRKAAEAVGEMVGTVGKGYGAFLSIVGGLGLVLSILIIVGAIQMMGGKSYGLAISAAIAALVPMPGCWFLGLGMGIWALVVLSKPEVKAVFR